MDAGFAAAATFAVGIYAARFLAVDQLGIYALFFASFVLATKIPRQLVLIPAEIRAIEREPQGLGRLALMRPAMRLAIVPAAVAGPLGGLAGALLATPASTHVVVPLAVTMAACGILQPLETHVRRMLHIAGVSWRAPIASGSQLAGVVLSLIWMSAAGLPALWIPFGSFAIGLLISIAVGLFIERRLSTSGATSDIDFSSIVRSGSQLVVVDLLPSLAAFLGAAIVLRMAGPEVLGFTEAARVASRPVGVFAVGLHAPLAPRAVDAAIQRNRAMGLRITRLFTVLLATVGLAYIAYAGWDWPGNVMAVLVPKAYAIEGLVAVAIIASVAQFISEPLASQMLGAKQEPSLIRIEAIGNLVRIGFAFAAPTLLSFALPCGTIGLGTVRRIGRSRATRRIYPSEPDVDKDHTQ